MNYKETLQAVDTEKALSLIGIEFESQGAYAKFNCPNDNCTGKALIKEYSDKKNLYYCPGCKSSGHIISLAMKTKGITWDEAKELLLKSHITKAGKITEELKMQYELHYGEFLKSKGVTEEECTLFEIGIPKGKTMLAGSVAFTVRDENGKKIAYYGIKVKDGKPIFHNSFNPEKYLWGFHRITNKESPLFFTTDMFQCLRLLSGGFQSVCNFGLPYISREQMELIKDFSYICLMVEKPLVKQFANQMAENYKGYFKFD
ncbi:MAG: CHC2 zinc finger domain-containing protein [Syntrophomonas sp.]